MTHAKPIPPEVAESIKSRTIVVPIIQNRNGEYLLIKMPVSRGVFPGKWGLPGGGIEPGERMHEALVREVREELGIDIERAVPAIFWDGEYEKLYPDGSKSKVYMIFLIFKCTAVSSDLKVSDEVLEYAWVSKCNLASFDLNEATLSTFRKLDIL